MADYDIEIEIDAESGDVIWRKGDVSYYYNVEMMENARIVLDNLQGDADITVYSQGQYYTYEEYKELSGAL